jgi:lipopolysaccharide cholinephosphotransferase
MATIPESFFEKEIRNDFEIDETMKKAWAIQLGMLEKTLEIARSCDIDIWLDYGSLLGAVRHKGYIPWDDDIDVCIMRKDYINFLFLLKRKLPEYCRVKSFYTVDNFPDPKAFVCNRDVIDIGKDPKQAKITENNYGLPYVAGIDLYPLDYAPSDDEQWNLIRQIYIAVFDLVSNYDTYMENGELEDLIEQLEDLLNVHLERDENLRQSLCRLCDSVAMMTPKEEAGSVIWYPDAAIRDNDMRRPLSAYDNTIITDFEFLKVPIPEGYDDVLKLCYGSNYMTPIRAVSTHGYPFYKEQDEIIRSHS